MAHQQLGDTKENADGTTRLDMSKRINWKDPDLQDQLSGFFIPADQSGWGKKRV